MVRVLVLNNYPLEPVWEQIRAGLKPDHHLFGINYFGDLGFDVEIVPFNYSEHLRKIQRWLGRALFAIPLGALDRQYWVWRHLNAADLIYAPCGSETNLLTYLRATGLLHIPIVSLQHHPLNQGRLHWLREPWFRAHVKGTDSMPALSSTIAAEINRRCPPSAPKSSQLPWGPDPHFYQVADSIGHGAVTAGRTGRDFLTFGRGAELAECNAEIICLRNDMRPEFKQLGSKVRTTVFDEEEPYPSFVQRLRNARVIAIPLLDTTHSLAGLTSLMDALALGRPVIMTPNRFIDLDVEKVGIGRWVAAGDVEGWCNALRWFEDNPEESFAMGQRARQLVDNEGVNSPTFACLMAGEFHRVLNRSES